MVEKVFLSVEGAREEGPREPRGSCVGLGDRGAGLWGQDVLGLFVRQIWGLYG